MSVLIIAEHDGKSLKNSVSQCVTAARALADEVHVLVCGEGVTEVASAAATIDGVTRVLTADASHYAHQLAEEVAPVVTSLAKDYQYVLAAATTTGKNLIPRVAALLDVQPLSDVMAIESADTFKRPVYAGNVIATVKSLESLKVMTVRTTAFDAAGVSDTAAPVDTVDAAAPVNISQFVGEELAKSDRPELTAARVVVSGGRGLQNGENFQLLYDLADKLDAAVGASRAAVDAGYVPNDMQVGQTGKIVAPDLYIAVGISGAIQHLAGMKDSRVIVAINKDEDAPIFQIADYGLVADLFDAVPALTQQLS